MRSLTILLCIVSINFLSLKVNSLELTIPIVIYENLSKNILTSENFSAENFNFIESDSRIQDYIFSPDSEIASPFAINLENKIIIVALKARPDIFLVKYSFVHSGESFSKCSLIISKQILIP